MGSCLSFYWHFFSKFLYGLQALWGKDLCLIHVSVTKSLDGSKAPIRVITGLQTSLRAIVLVPVTNIGCRNKTTSRISVVWHNKYLFFSHFTTQNRSGSSPPGSDSGIQVSSVFWVCSSAYHLNWADQQAKRDQAEDIMEILGSKPAMACITSSHAPLATAKAGCGPGLPTE